MKLSSLILSLFIAMWLTQPLYAAFDDFDFSGEVTEKRFQNLVSKLRCLVCQNESLAGSQAELAKDLRREVYQLMKSGKNDSEVIDFLINRYGDFVLYQPPLRPSTWLLWIGPFVFFAIAVFLLMRRLAKRSKMQEAVLNDDDKAKVQQLLDNTSSDQE